VIVSAVSEHCSSRKIPCVQLTSSIPRARTWAFVCLLPATFPLTHSPLATVTTEFATYSPLHIYIQSCTQSFLLLLSNKVMASRPNDDIFNLSATSITTLDKLTRAYSTREYKTYPPRCQRTNSKILARHETRPLRHCLSRSAKRLLILTRAGEERRRRRRG
jgi:hypothetical protein